MKYRVEPIGAEFSSKDFPRIAERFNEHAAAGYRFHSVFQVVQSGCLGTNRKATYLAVYVSDED